eukprot:scaffold114455_cov66-Phaeocystis_antarctica.AAC.2
MPENMARGDAARRATSGDVAWSGAPASQHPASGSAEMASSTVDRVAIALKSSSCGAEAARRWGAPIGAPGSPAEVFASVL